MYYYSLRPPGSQINSRLDDERGEAAGSSYVVATESLLRSYVRSY